MAEIHLPVPAIDFPRLGWIDRVREYVDASGAGDGRIGRATPPCGGMEACEAALGVALPDELRALYRDCDGLNLGFVGVLSLKRVQVDTQWIAGQVAPEEWEGCFPPDVRRTDLVAFAMDGAGDHNGYRLGHEGAHRVIYVCHDPPAAEHRYTSLATFIEAWSARAYATAIWHALERDHGMRSEHNAWLKAAVQLEREIDPGVLNELGE